MLNKNSKYECPVCKATLEAAVGISISCSRCNVKMNEIKKGVVTKGRADEKKRKA